MKNFLRFYFITDDRTTAPGPLKQVEIAICAGATMVQYRNKSFSLADFNEARAIRDLCRLQGVPFIVNDHILLAKALDADGVHVGQTDHAAGLARNVLGADAIIGVSAADLDEMGRTDLSVCDYIGTGPVFATGTKADAGKAIGPEGLQTVTLNTSLPVVAIGGIDASRVSACFTAGAAGVALISAISRANDPLNQAREIGRACGCRERTLQTAWRDEFGLIEKLILKDPCPQSVGPCVLEVGPGDDAALLSPIARPVITTDTHRENVHFRRSWQTLEEIGQKAVEVTFSDLAASYARPRALFVNLSLPATVSDADVETIYAGINTALSRHGAVLGGGNISSGREFSLDLFAVGEGHAEIFPQRALARPGDGLYVTGPLGLARAGLECLKIGEMAYPVLIEKFKTPRARFDAAGILAEFKVACAMDVSDGLAGDAGHIAAASKISVRFEDSFSVVHPVLMQFCLKNGDDPHLMMLSGGEDYELLFACDPSVFEKIKTRIPEAFSVGTCLPFSGELMVNLPPGVRAFAHGRDLQA